MRSCERFLLVLGMKYIKVISHDVYQVVQTLTNGLICLRQHENHHSSANPLLYRSFFQTSRYSFRILRKVSVYSSREKFLVDRENVSLWSRRDGLIYVIFI